MFPASNAVEKGSARLLETAVRYLAPESGTPENTKRVFRSFPFGPYRVYYRALAERKTLELLKIW
jgi:hypothetical protein